MYKKYYTRFLAISFLIMIIILHFAVNYNFSSFNPGSAYYESRIDPVTIIFITPAILLLLINRKWFDVAVILIFWLLFMTGKFVTNYLPIYIFAVYLNFVGKHIIIPKEIMLIFAIILIVALISTINFNFNYISLKTCNIETKICDDKNDLSLAHYFAWLGFKSQSQVCKCF
jgi:hypothetical protein